MHAVPLLPMFLQVLRDFGSITFVLADDLGSKLCGMTNLDTAVVYLSERNTDGEMLATIGHELAHLANPTASEAAVELAAAMALIPACDALRAAATGDLRSVADQCGVDEQLVRARIRGHLAVATEEEHRGVG